MQKKIILIAGRSCGPSPVSRLDNGVVLGLQQTYKFGDRIFFQCDVGYMWEGSEFMECRADGRWIGEIPTCRGTNVFIEMLILSVFPIFNTLHSKISCNKIMLM